MYPLFEFPGFGGGMIVALIATFHILPSHLATGGFWMTYFLERQADAENRPDLVEFLKKFTLLVLIFCFVSGSITGVGIWYASTIISPRAISGLIHNYVWGWATEWVFFIIEIVTIYIYYYTFGKIAPRHHRRIALIYALAAWFSMVIITGILAFMLDSGKWVETGGFFDGFFNPTYWPQLFFRTAMMFVIAGAYAAIVGSFLENRETRRTVSRTASLWGLGGLLAAALFGFWYYTKLPARTEEILAAFPYAATMLKVSLVVAAVTAVYFVLLLLTGDRLLKPGAAIAMVVVIFLGIGGGESVREIGRRPYLIPGYMYSNQVIADDLPAKGIHSEVERFDAEGILAHYAFLPPQWRTVTAGNFLETGNIITRLQCLSCHTMEPGGRSSLPDLVNRLGTTTAEDIGYFLASLGDYPYMPHFAGTPAEQRAAAAYMAVLVGGAAANDGIDPQWVVEGE
jgi:cytochrome bd-type quinol oxidase subunit 1